MSRESCSQFDSLPLTSLTIPLFAEQMVIELLVVQDDATNVLKNQQLRELALINGTLREQEACTVCGEEGHRSYLCPNRDRGFKMANVRCAKCGGAHVTAEDSRPGYTPSCR